MKTSNFRERQNAIAFWRIKNVLYFNQKGQVTTTNLEADWAGVK